MKICVVVLVFLVCASPSIAEIENTFEAGLTFITEDGDVLTFGEDSYRIEPPDRGLSKNWKADDPCRIKESGPRPESYARIFNKRTENYVRGIRLKNEADLKREKQQAEWQRELARHREERWERERREAQMESLLEQQQRIENLTRELAEKQRQLHQLSAVNRQALQNDIWRLQQEVNTLNRRLR